MALFAVAGQAAMDTAGVALGGGAMKQAQDMFNAQATQNKRYFAASWVRHTVEGPAFVTASLTHQYSNRRRRLRGGMASRSCRPSSTIETSALCFSLVQCPKFCAKVLLLPLLQLRNLDGCS